MIEMKDMDSFGDIIKGYSKRKPSSFSFEKKASDYEERLYANTSQGVQNGYANTNEGRGQSRIVSNKEIRDRIGGNQIYEAPHRPNGKGRSRTGYKMYGGRSPNQEVYFTRDIYGDTGYGTDRPDMTLGSRDAPVHMYTPKWNFYQPPSGKYGLSVQNFTDPYIARYGRNYLDWEGNLTDDRAQAALIDTLTGEQLTEPPEALPPDQFAARYRPVMAPNKHTIYSMGAEKDAYHEMELQRNREYLAAFETSQQIKKLMDETGLPESFFLERDPASGVSIYEQIFGAISARNNKEEEEIRTRMAGKDAEYKKLTDKASQLAQQRLDEHIKQYGEFMENPEAYTEPVKQPKGFWVFGTGDHRHKGHYSYAPQLKQYYREELAKLMGEPTPEPEDEFDPIAYYNNVVEQYPEMAEALSELEPETLEYLNGRGFDYSQYYTQGPDGNPVLRTGITPEAVADQIERIMGEDAYHKEYDATHRADAQKEIENNRAKDLQNHVENRIRIQRRAYKRAGMPYTPEQEAKDRERFANEVSVYETPRQAKARMEQETRERVRQRMESLLQNHDRNRDDPVESGKGIGSLMADYKTLHQQVIDLGRKIRLAEDNGQPAQSILRMQAELESMGDKLDKMRGQIIEQARAAGITPETGNYTVYTQRDGDADVSVVDEFDDEGYLNPRFMDVANGPRRRFNFLEGQSRVEIDQNDLLNRIRETGRGPKMVDPQNYTNAKGRAKFGARVLPGEENMYDQTATDIYWKLNGFGGLTSDFKQELDQAVQGTEFQARKRARSDAKRAQIKTMNATQPGRTREDAQLAMVDLHNQVNNTILPQYAIEAHQWVQDKGTLDGLPEEYFMSPEQIQAKQRDIAANKASIPPAVRVKMLGEEPGWDGDNKGLINQRFQRTGKLLMDTIKNNVHPQYRSQVLQLISDNPANDWQGVLKMLTDPNTLSQGAVWSGDPKQVAYAVQHFVNAKDDLEALDGESFYIDSEQGIVNTLHAADVDMGKFVDENGQLKVPKVKVPKGEGDPYEGRGRYAAIRDGNVTPENIEAHKKRIKAAEEKELTVNSEDFKPHPDPEQETAKQQREIVRAMDTEQNNKAQRDAEVSAEFDKIVAENTAREEAENKATNQAEYKDKLLNTTFPLGADADPTGEKETAKKLQQQIGQSGGDKNDNNDDGTVIKSWSMRDMEEMSFKEMLSAISKSEKKDGHPYGKPIQGNVFAYGSTISTLGDGRDAPMPETIPTKKTNEEGATSRKLDL